MSLNVLNWPGLVVRFRVHGVRVRIYVTGMTALAAFYWLFGVVILYCLPLFTDLLTGVFPLTDGRLPDAMRWQPVAALPAAVLGPLGTICHELGHILGLAVTGRGGRHRARSLVLGATNCAIGDRVISPNRNALFVLLGPIAGISYGLILIAAAAPVTRPIGVAGLLAVIVGLSNLLPFGLSNAADGTRLRRYLTGKVRRLPSRS